MKKLTKELIPYIVIIVAVIIIRTYIVTPVIVVGDSMVPTLEDNQILLLNKLDYKLNEIERLRYAIKETKSIYLKRDYKKKIADITSEIKEYCGYLGYDYESIKDKYKLWKI